MPNSLIDRIQHAWNAFTKSPDRWAYRDDGPSYGDRPDRVRLAINTGRTQLAAMYLRIAIDSAQLTYRHAKIDQNERYTETINSRMNNCFNIEANLDQESGAFFRDLVLSLCDEGVVAVVPVDTTINPAVSGAFDITTMRVGRIVDWKPERVLVDLYNQRTGIHEQLWVDKRTTAIIENPLYTVMNAPNSTLMRLNRKLNLLDYVDEQTSSGKLDLIIQLPYTLRTESKRTQAENRRKDIEMQLSGSKYGIAYIDGTETITQLNRPAENNLLAQVELLSAQVYSEVGIAKAVIDGNADEIAMLNYHNRVIEPIASAISKEFTRKFLTKTAITQGQRILFFMDPFKLVPISQIAEIADKFTRNEIMSPNEIRPIVGLKPVEDPEADELRNRNLNKQLSPDEAAQPTTTEEESNQNET
ncbi:MAG: phage portal protein [Bacteroidia bacterium]|nr:phage portal protein [Bacteroidia bacterium]